MAMADKMQKTTRITIISGVIIDKEARLAGDFMDVPEDLAQNLIKRGKAVEGEQKIKAAPANKAVDPASTR